MSTSLSTSTLPEENTEEDRCSSCCPPKRKCRQTPSPHSPQAGFSRFWNPNAYYRRDNTCTQPCATPQIYAYVHGPQPCPLSSLSNAIPLYIARQTVLTEDLSEIESEHQSLETLEPTTSCLFVVSKELADLGCILSLA